MKARRSLKPQFATYPGPTSSICEESKRTSQSICYNNLKKALRREEYLLQKSCKVIPSQKGDQLVSFPKFNNSMRSTTSMNIFLRRKNLASTSNLRQLATWRYLSILNSRQETYRPPLSLSSWPRSQHQGMLSTKGKSQAIRQKGVAWKICSQETFRKNAREMLKHIKKSIWT